MSQIMLKDDVMFYQRLLKCNGLYPYKLDGVWGSKTDAADKEFTRQSQEIASRLGTFDSRSEANILGLAPKAQELARKFLNIFKAAGKDVRIISCTRTYAEQDALYKKGRFGSTEPQVTKAKGGQSNHNFGIAWDIGLFEGGKYITADNKYKALAPLVKAQLPELEWGGDWHSFPDVPHYQLKAKCEGIAAVRESFESGTAYV